MGADWGLYSALRGTDNWAQKRQDKMQTLMFLDQEQKMSEQNLQKQMELEQGMNDYFDKIASLEVNPEDQERVNEEERNARRDIYKGLAAVNGNLKLYMQTGGISALSKYRRNILNSDAVKNAGVNKTNLANFQDDIRDNKFIKQVTIDVPVMDKDGNPKIVDGKAVTKQETMPMEKAVNLYRQGIVTKLNYNGGETKIKIDPFKFSKQPKDPNNPFVAQVVTTSDVYNYAISQGGSKEYAADLAREYGKNAIKDKPWMWGKEDEDAANLMKAKALKAMRGSTGGSEKTTTLNQTTAKLSRTAENARQTGKKYGKEIMGPEEIDFWNADAGLKFDSKINKYVPTKDLTLVDRDNQAEYTTSNAISVNNTGEYVYDAEQNKYFAVMDVIYPANAPLKGNPHKEWAGFWNEYSDDSGATKNNWQFMDADEAGLVGMDDGFDVIKGQAFYDVSGKVKNQAYMDQLNKWVGVKSTFEGAAPSANTYEQRVEANNTITQLTALNRKKGYDEVTAKKMAIAALRQ